MMSHLRVCLLIFGTLFAFVSGARAEEYGWGAPQPLPGQPSRPCGPDSLKGPLRNLIPQGFYGAEFRSACVRHDACYDTYGINRMICEANFRADLLKACDCSERPIRCRIMARFMATNVKRFGQDAFDSAQSIAKQKLANGG